MQRGLADPAFDATPHLAQDPGTKVIALYVEGVRDGRRFLAAVEAARRAGKPVVVLKGGLTQASARAAAAHTGAFAGEGRVFAAIARECRAAGRMREQGAHERFRQS